MPLGVGSRRYALQLAILASCRPRLKAWAIQGNGYFRSGVAAQSERYLTNRFTGEDADTQEI